jgi:hypothetical protein
MAFYPHALDDDAVATLYRALMIGTEPQLTGYVKEVFIDRPTFYTRLNEVAGSTAVRNFIRPDDIYSAVTFGGIAFQQPSSVLGGNTALFNGAAAIVNKFNGAGRFSTIGYSIEFIAQPANAAPTAVEILFSTTSSATAATRFAPEARRVAGGAFALVHDASGVETVTFATHPDTTAPHHYLFVVDKRLATACLYVDGALVETVATNVILLDVMALATVPNTVVSRGNIGAIATDLGALTSPYSGLLGEVAFYPVPLSALRAQQHFEACAIP